MPGCLPHLFSAAVTGCAAQDIRAQLDDVVHECTAAYADGSPNVCTQTATVACLIDRAPRMKKPRLLRFTGKNKRRR